MCTRRTPTNRTPTGHIASGQNDTRPTADVTHTGHPDARHTTDTGRPDTSGPSYLGHTTHPGPGHTTHPGLSHATHPGLVTATDAGHTDTDHTDTLRTGHTGPTSLVGGPTDGSALPRSAERHLEDGPRAAEPLHLRRFFVQAVPPDRAAALSCEDSSHQRATAPNSHEARADGPATGIRAVECGNPRYRKKAPNEHKSLLAPTELVAVFAFVSSPTALAMALAAPTNDIR
ncbi:MAG TPA: hypothetical protein VMM60_14070 [Ilumatobacter sp.]|nr:hypothetical protein [Ilumatobacter sp.]